MLHGVQQQLNVRDVVEHDGAATEEQRAHELPD